MRDKADGVQGSRSDTLMVDQSGKKVGRWSVVHPVFTMVIEIPSCLILFSCVHLVNSHLTSAWYSLSCPSGLHLLTSVVNLSVVCSYAPCVC